MPHTSLILGESPRCLAEVGRTIEATGLFQTILSSTDLNHALERLHEIEVDAIFVAPGHLDASNSQALGQLAHRAQDRDIPVLLLLADNQEEQRIRGLECGISDCMSTTTGAQELALRTRRYLDQKSRMQSLRRANEDLARQSITDSLSGLHNRRYFDRVLETEVARCNRNGEAFALLLLDLDHFKRINDQLGHPVGDKVIQMVGQTLLSGIRSSDTCCRYGGEEFALIMPATRAPEAKLVAERLRQKVATLDIPGIPQGHQVTISVGISLGDCRTEIKTQQVLLEADQALYAAKANGRNCCVLRGEHRPQRRNAPRRPVSGFTFRLPQPCVNLS